MTTLMATPPWPRARSGSETAEELGDGPPDLGRRVLLDEVAPAHRDLPLVGPRPAELPLRADEDAARLGVHEELGHRARREPPRVGVGDGDDVGRLALDRDLARPGERGAARLARLAVAPAVHGHLGLAQPA